MRTIAGARLQSGLRQPIRKSSVGIAAVLTFLIAPVALRAQEATSEVDELSFYDKNLEYIVIGLLILVLSIVVFALMGFGDRLIRISSAKLSREKGNNDEARSERYRLVPRITPEGAQPNNVVRIKRGFDIHIAGKPAGVIQEYKPSTYAIRPVDFIGMSPIPKVLVEVGQEVKAGDPVLFDKKRPDISYNAPVSGEVVEIRRGDKRRIEEVVILADGEQQYRDFGKADAAECSTEEVIERLVQSGAWTAIKERPFDIVPNPNDRPKLVYISCFDTSPLAPDYDLAMQGQEEAFQAGVHALSKLSAGGVHLGLNAKKKHCRAFTSVTNTTDHWFQGPHPAGNPGIQIHHVAPINKGEAVWILNPQDVAMIGRLFTEGIYKPERVIAVAGPKVKTPGHYRTMLGACLEPMISSNTTDDHVRYISGNVLTGRKMQRNEHMRASDQLISVIAEGDQSEFLGWLFPGKPRPTVSPTFMSFFHHGEEIDVSTNQHGEERAFVVTGRYEEVLPMDIYPMQLLKAIMAQDFDKMEGLGIYEISEEDFALCEFVCPSKVPIQSIVRDGLDLVRQG